MFQQPESRRKSLVVPTYGVTILMLIIGQIQVVAVNEIKTLKDFLESHYSYSLIQFFVSFLSIQLYGFFYRIIVSKPKWVRILAGLWTYEINTFSVMKSFKGLSYFSLIISALLTFLVMLISVTYGCVSANHRRGLFTSRENVFLWSERIFVLTSFGIIASSEMKRVFMEFSAMLIYTLMSNVFVIIFAASVRRPHFYHYNAEGDYILIGQLYYLNYFALFMSYVWTLELFMQIMEWKVTLNDVQRFILLILNGGT